MVRISNKVLLSGGLSTVIGIAGCSKYEDNPAISFSTKTQRLTGDWEVTKLKANGDCLFDCDAEIELEFDSDGDFDMKVTYSSSNSSGSSGESYSVSGEWEFSSDKEDLELDFDDNDEYDWEIEITRLTNKELEGELTLVGLGKFDFEAEKQ